MKRQFYLLYPKFYLLLIVFSLLQLETKASHIVGGEFTYHYLGDTIIRGTICTKYQVTLTIYEDCLTGSPQAIDADNPAYLGVYDGPGFDSLVYADSVNYTSWVTVPTGFSNACVTNIPKTCLIKKIFLDTFYLPPNNTGYLLSNQRCCRNGSIGNIVQPANTGSTFYCIIPPYPQHNSSAVFNNYPPQIICLDNPLFYDNSATDPDNDSLSYEFCASVTCCLTGGPNNVKPWPPSGPDISGPTYYDSVIYLPGFTAEHPMTGFPAIQIDPVTGLITGTPNAKGRYLVTVCCHEWRDGVMINTSKREFQFVVTSCSKAVIADMPQYSTDPNTYIVDCNNYTINFQNTSTGGFSYHWDFGVPGAPQDTSNEFEPTFTYPDTGTFSVKLVVNPHSTCPDSITRLVKVYPKFRAAFSDSGARCPGSTVYFTDLSTSTLKPIIYWKWLFGDGDSSLAENPVHAYIKPGIYNVSLVSENYRSCIDTAVNQLIIDNFTPFAGNDTAIVKGSSILFNATGGTKFTWSPPTNLSDTNIFNPVGIYPDTGHFTYYVHVVSAYGCTGLDSIKVDVVNQASFVVPSAFTPNGDGKNDVFRPLAVGYRNLNYFRVFNRWGQEVYFSTTLEAGWDGYYRSKEADMGTYFWEISFTDRFGKNGFMKGDVVLIR